MGGEFTVPQKSNPNSFNYLCDDLQVQEVHLIIGQSRGSQDDPARFACNGEL